MASPNIGDAKKDKILTELSLAYRNLDYIAEKILPILRVKERTGYYATYGTQALRYANLKAYREPGTRAMTVDYSTAQTAYSCHQRALEKRVPDELAANTDKPYEPKRDATEFLSDMLANTKELSLATSMSSTSVLTQYTTLSGTSQWSDYANSNPLQDILTGRSTVHASIGRDPNVAVFGRSTWVQFIQHPDVVDRIKYVGLTAPDQILKAVADLLEVDEVYIGKGIYISSNEGQSDTKATIWGKHFWLLHRPPRPSLMAPSFGYHFVDEQKQVETYREETHKSDVIRLLESYDQKVMDATAAYFVQSAVA